jgi:hypothetical protein
MAPDGGRDGITVSDELADAVHAAFEPAHLSIWIREL